MVYQLAIRDDRVVFIGSDLSPGLLSEMKRDFPKRYYMEGVTEQNVIGMAAGMAMDGYMPFVNTIATFITRRCYEQVALDLCLHDLPVRLIGNGGGLVYAPLGPTHLAIEDIAIMRALPNMTVTAVADAEEMTRLMEATLNWPHPIYIRLGKGGDPVVSDEKHGFAIGKGIVMRRAPRTSAKVVLISTGVMTARALDAADLIESRGHNVEVIHIHTIKPLDEALVIERCADAAMVAVLEEHTVTGGLGSAVAEVILDNHRGKVPQFLRLGIPDRFAVNYGLQDDLLRVYRLQPDQVADRVLRALREVASA